MLKKTIFVSDIQPVLPAVSGGRLRIVGLWGNTTEQFPVTYVGTYDSPGKMYCKKVMGENAIQIIEPCDKKIFEAIEECNAYFPALSMFDILFPHLSEYYQAFIETSRCHMQKSDIIVFSHPWTYNALYPFIDDQLVIYDAHNVESYLRAQMLLEYQYRNTGPVLLRKIIEVEYQLLHRCDLILACSQRDSSQFQALFEVDSSKILQVPNGAFVLQNFALSNSVKYRIKKRLRLSRQYIGIFSGSNYGPNIDALQFINAIAPLHPTVDFIITGDMTHLLPQQPISDNVHLLGLLEQSAFETALRISDFALNPIFSGSGSNVKL
jgi:hypothetical protein